MHACMQAVMHENQTFSRAQVDRITMAFKKLGYSDSHLIAKVRFYEQQ